MNMNGLFVEKYKNYDIYLSYDVVSKEPFYCMDDINRFGNINSVRYHIDNTNKLKKFQFNCYYLRIENEIKLVKGYLNFSFYKDNLEYANITEKESNKNIILNHYDLYEYNNDNIKKLKRIIKIIKLYNKYQKLNQSEGYISGDLDERIYNVMKGE